MGDIESVRTYWESRPCGADNDPHAEGTPGYFAWLTQTRYKLEPFISKYARFEQWRGLSVLEVGVGAGTDAEQFARAAAKYSGIDLTERGVALTRRRLELLGLVGSIERANAEKLPFPDGSFDFVYSWGVIHHSPHAEVAAREMIRVCRPGGQICCMVYNRRSIYALQGRKPAPGGVRRSQRRSN